MGRELLKETLRGSGVRERLSSVTDEIPVLSICLLSLCTSAVNACSARESAATGGDVNSAMRASSSSCAMVSGALATTKFAMCGCRPARMANLTMLSSGVSEIFFDIFIIAVT